MKNTIVLLILLLYPGFSMLSPAQTAHVYFYVSPDGNDENPGTLDKPLASFEGAKQRIKESRLKAPQTPVTVCFRGGKYYRRTTAVFDSGDGGTANAPVKYMAYPGEIPVIQGGIRLSLKWEEYRDGIYKASVPEGLVFESLYINDQEQVLARYPNHDPDSRIFNGTAADCIAPNRVRKWENPKDAYFHVLHKSMWGAFHYKVSGKQGASQLVLEGGEQNNRPENGIHDELRYIENVFEELDTVREWFLDRDNGIVYYKPEPGTDLEKANVEVAFLESFIELRGNKNNPVKNLSFEGFHFNRSVRTFMKTTEKLLRSDWAIYRGGAVFLEGTEYCSIVSCRFSQIGGNAVFFSAYNRNGLVEGCHIEQTGANGICLVGDTSVVRNPKFVPYGPPVTEEELDPVRGPRGEDYPAHCTIHDNLIHDFGKIEKQVAGVQISMAAFIRVSHNSIYNCPRAGINIGEGAWGGHIIEFNDVFNTVLETSDHGSFNSWGRDRYWMVGNDRTEERVEADRSVILLDILAPTIIRNNRMRCDHGWDIDLDDGSSYYHIYNNLCLKNGIKLREGYYRKVENNICLNNSIHPHVWLKNNNDVIRGNLFGTAFFPIRVNYWGREIDYNWFMSQEALRKNQGLGLDTHSEWGNPLFVNAADGDFRVMPQSRLLELGWKNFPMDEFGVVSPELRALAQKPEMPSIELPRYEQKEELEFFGGVIGDVNSEGILSATGMYARTGAFIIQVPDTESGFVFRLQEGDVVLQADNQKILDARSLHKLSNQFRQGRVKTLTVWRNQSRIMLE